MTDSIQARLIEDERKALKARGLSTDPYATRVYPDERFSPGASNLLAEYREEAIKAIADHLQTPEFWEQFIGLPLTDDSIYAIRADLQAYVHAACGLKVWVDFATDPATRRVTVTDVRVDESQLPARGHWHDIHYIDFAEHRNVRLLCNGSCGEPTQRGTEVWHRMGGYAGPFIHLRDDGRLYTFFRQDVTCKRCLRKLRGAEQKGSI